MTSNMQQRSFCFFDIEIDHNYQGRLIFELYNDIVPKTAQYFQKLCTGQYGYSYQKTPINRIVFNYMAQAGTVSKLYESEECHNLETHLPPENYKKKHSEPYLLSMINNPQNGGIPQFCITFVQCPWLDRKQVVFGRLIDGKDVIQAINDAGSSDGTPKVECFIANCGEYCSKQTLFDDLQTL